MDSLADAARFLVAYPNGTGGNYGLYPSDWNAGSCCGGAYRDNVDDLAFIAALITEVSKYVPVDAHRIYVAGFSAGGRMAYHVGCQLSATVAAIAVVSGSLVDYGCAPANAVPLWATHGTDDPEVAYDEPAPDPPGPVPSIADSLPPSVQFWSALNACTGGTAQATAADVAGTTFTPCTGATINFFTIVGGTHGWPGGPDDPGAQPPMNEIKASVLMWQFFLKHRR
jgi:polyhydroxybutyrate depolymerase